MARRKVLLDGDELLRKKSKPVKVFDNSLKELFSDMEETLRREDGAGLSAVQIGVLKNMFIILDHKVPIRVVNPEILSQSGINKIKEEGCLSVPGKVGEVERPNKIRARFQDDEGNVVEKEFSGFVCKAFCHEFDHLNGILFTDRATCLFNSYDEYFKFRAKQERLEKKAKKENK